jgi:Ribosomal protein L11, RNA binding domain
MQVLRNVLLWVHTALACMLCLQLLCWLAAGIEKGSGKPNKDKVGSVTKAQILVGYSQPGTLFSKALFQVVSSN